ncbi:MAG: hypothetical protein RML15_00605 [Bacteroidota bacterium]|nr:hypothetical protein [Candidatus Kapabacteria bacterium]MCS7302394.1 hypothetical protein [Candidatus Kapabacteria bacterium]MCX7937132.1 hypothetical protein [Chlorobiota bacterium]MDW8074625.1 hypothetical protein [Bacteroidota bacterium]MDW8270899.1 hypothetical protein [Bacteroidota bacterium]
MVAKIVRVLVLSALIVPLLYAQAIVPGGRNPNQGEVGEVIPPDTVFIFSSPRPLISAQPVGQKTTMWGLQILFSQSGFGGGAFIQHSLSDVLSVFADLGISGARKSSEIETIYDPVTGRFLVPGKVNWLFIFPLMIGVQHRLFTESLSETMRPFISGGVGPTLIVATPYQYEFFQSWGYARGYIRLGAFVGVGTYIGPPSRGSVALNVRYYTIPFGGQGLESIQGQPITDFGGLFLTFAVGLN